MRIGRFGMALALVVGVAGLVGAQESDYTKDSLEQVKSRVQAGKAVLVDVREQKEWDRGHIKKAVFLPLSKLSTWERDGIPDADKAELQKTLPKGTVIYCHCAAGGRSVPGSEALRKLGYDAQALKQGYTTLIKEGFPKE